MPHAEYFYVKPDNLHDKRLLLEGDEFHHLTNVCRKKSGDRLYAVDGVGTWYECELVNVGRAEAEARILSTRYNVGEPQFRLTLAQAPPKGNRFDIVVEKGTEIGVCRFVPMQTEYSVKLGSGKVERWRRIALAAMKQCGRSVWPEVTEVLPIDGVLERFENDEVRFIAHQEGPEGSVVWQELMSSFGDSAQSGIVLVGPEGGFAAAEVRHAQEHGFRTARIGPRRLRSETAGIVAATLLLSRLGDLR